MKHIERVKRMLGRLMVMLCCVFPIHGVADHLRVDFYDMGKADAMLITTPSEKHILIDCGTDKGGKKLVEHLNEANVQEIDLLIVTHYDKDHVGGADRVMEAIPVHRVMRPIYEKESKQYTQFVEAIRPETADQPLHTGEGTAEAWEDGVMLEVTAAHKENYGQDEENDYSLSLRLSYGEVKLFFTGDAEALRQAELLEEGNVACDVLKVPYHGRLVRTSEAFLKAAAPKIAYITDDEKNPASEEVIRILETLGTQVYSSRKDGDISVVSDGKNVQVLH